MTLEPLTLEPPISKRQQYKITRLRGKRSATLLDSKSTSCMDTRAHPQANNIVQEGWKKSVSSEISFDGL